MAARRGRGAAAAEPPPPSPEPAPEPEPEKVEEPPPAPEPEADSKSTRSKNVEVTEKVIERIIMFPGPQPQGMMGFNPMMYQQPPPPQPPPPPPRTCPCSCKQCCVKKKGKKKDKNKDSDGDEPCRHKFCLIQRSKIKPQGLPWASGLYPGPSPKGALNKQLNPQASKQSVVVCQRPVVCCPPMGQSGCADESDSEDEEDEEDEEPQKKNFDLMNFMNLVFAATNVIKERPDVF